MNFSLAIDDDLASELCKFKNNQHCNVKIIEKILHYYKDYPIFTKNYFLQYYSRDTQQALLQSNSSINWDSIETIAKSTIYKVILSSKKRVDFPYISIYTDKIENNFTATFFIGESRQKALEHLSALLKNANCIFIYDAYLFSDNVWSAFIDFATQCFPNKILNIFYPQSIMGRTPQFSQISNSKWRFKADRIHHNFANLHDRYLIIDDKIEIIFTSGIEYLMDNNKDFTYIVRTHKNSVNTQNL
ncbi:hypothetical protein ACWIUD_02090 [Helicobacter sp. 23-1044]